MMYKIHSTNVVLKIFFLSLAVANYLTCMPRIMTPEDREKNKAAGLLQRSIRRRLIQQEREDRHRAAALLQSFIKRRLAQEDDRTSVISNASSLISNFSSASAAEIARLQAQLAEAVKRTQRAEMIRVLDQRKNQFINLIGDALIKNQRAEKDILMAFKNSVIEFVENLFEIDQRNIEATGIQSNVMQGFFEIMLQPDATINNIRDYAQQNQLNPIEADYLFRTYNEIMRDNDNARGGSLFRELIAHPKRVMHLVARDLQAMLSWVRKNPMKVCLLLGFTALAGGITILVVVYSATIIPAIILAFEYLAAAASSGAAAAAGAVEAAAAAATEMVASGAIAEAMGGAAATAAAAGTEAIVCSLSAATLLGSILATIQTRRNTDLATIQTRRNTDLATIQRRKNTDQDHSNRMPCSP